MKSCAELTRFRKHKIMRDMLSCVNLNPQNFMQIIFVDENLSNKKPVPNMQHFWLDCPSSIIQTIEADVLQGIKSFLLFCVPKNKEKAFEFTCNTVQQIKSHFGNKIFLACDLCLCGMTHDGHCGFIDTNKQLINNHATVEVLARNALGFAKSGADCIAPSDMQDGRIKAIRGILNDHGFDDISIMSYSTKFASNYYSAFRTIYQSGIDKNSPLKDRKTYQIDFRNTKDAILSSIRDELEGADILMVKPIIRYLDIVKEIQATCKLPLAGFHVSTECVSLNLLANHEYGDLASLFMEDWIAIKRSGIDIIITYNARMVRLWANKGE